VVKQVFADFPQDAAAGPEKFQGHADMGEHGARWDLAITGGEPPLSPLRPPVLYRTPLPRTKLVASVPDGQVTGRVEIDGREVDVAGWRGTVGHNWGSEHADSWVWLHAADFGAAPEMWLELVLARVKVGPARSPWMAMGALSIAGERIELGGLGRRPSVDARAGRLSADVPSPRARLRISVTTDDDDAVAVPYGDPRGGSRTVRHAALAGVELTLRRPGHREVTLSSSRGAYEYGSRADMPGIRPQPVPEG
jgi:hypothetical protein